MSDSLDLDKLKLTPEALAQIQSARAARAAVEADPTPTRRVSPPSRKERREADGFIAFPTQLFKLRPCKAPYALPLAGFLLWQRHLQEKRRRKPSGTPTTVSNIELDRWCQTRWQKKRALAKLTAMELIEVCQAGKQSPRVLLRGPLWGKD